MEQHPSRSETKSIKQFRQDLEQELASPEAAELPEADKALFETLLANDERLAQFIFPEANQDS
jgi:hypothetical protein